MMAATESPEEAAPASRAPRRLPLSVQGITGNHAALLGNNVPSSCGGSGDAAELWRAWTERHHLKLQPWRWLESILNGVMWRTIRTGGQQHRHWRQPWCPQRQPEEVPTGCDWWLTTTLSRGQYSLPLQVLTPIKWGRWERKLWTLPQPTGCTTYTELLLCKDWLNQADTE